MIRLVSFQNVKDPMFLFVFILLLLVTIKYIKQTDTYSMFSAGANGNRGCVKKLRKFKLPAHTKITSKPRKTNHATLKCDPGYFFSKGKNINFLSCSRLTNFSSKQIPKCKGKSVCFHILLLYV